MLELFVFIACLAFLIVSLRIALTYSVDEIRERIKGDGKTEGRILRRVALHYALGFAKAFKSWKQAGSAHDQNKGKRNR